LTRLFLTDSPPPDFNSQPVHDFLYIATSTIAGYNPTIGGFNFQVDGRRKGNSNFIQITLIIGPDQAWTSVQLSYLVSSRDDFFLWNGAYTSTGWSKKNNQVDTYDIIA
jgi:phospholipase/lecithinase/hemolysin